MLGSKKFEKTIILLTVFALLFSVFAVCFPNIFSYISKDKAQEEYAAKLFGRDVINIEITADEDTWDEMLENKLSKPYIACDLKIDGKAFDKVGIRPKGNSSLTSIRGDRISFRLDFDHYIDNQTCYGLEKMVLNNLQADATYMKDYIAYDLMAYEGVKAPLHTFAFITLNGEPFGVYLAVEVYDEDYLQRAYGNTDIKLYSVKSSGLDEFESAFVDSESAKVIESYGIVEAKGMNGPPDGGNPPPMGNDAEQGAPRFDNAPPPPEDSRTPGATGLHSEMPLQDNGAEREERIPGDGGFEDRVGPPDHLGKSGGGDLVYVDDLTESYSEIFANAVFEDTNAEDYAKVIRAIKYLNKENATTEELEQYWDVDSALRYLAVHTFMVNGDSYTGNMKQNYYLAEIDGKITVLPWDYNLSFGAFGGGPGSEHGQSTSINKTMQTINLAIDTPTIEASMESRPLVSVLLGREEYKDKYYEYLDDLTKYASGEFLNKLEILEDKIYPYIEREMVSFYEPVEHKNAFNVLKEFLTLRSQSIQKQLNGEISARTDKQTAESLVFASFSIEEMGSMGNDAGGPPPEFENSRENAMENGGRDDMQVPPREFENVPENEDGNAKSTMSNGVPQNKPPQGPPPGASNAHGGRDYVTLQTNNIGGYVLVVISSVIFCIAFVFVKKYKRNY